METFLLSQLTNNPPLKEGWYTVKLHTIQKAPTRHYGQDAPKPMITLVFSLANNPKYFIGRTCHALLLPKSKLVELTLKMYGRKAPCMTCLLDKDCMLSKLKQLIGHHFKAYLTPSKNKKFMNVEDISSMIDCDLSKEAQPVTENKESEELLKKEFGKEQE